jgi:uncharacterized protein YvpB
VHAWIRSNRTITVAALGVPAFFALAVMGHQVGFLFGYRLGPGPKSVPYATVVATRTSTQSPTPTTPPTRTATLPPTTTPTAEPPATPAPLSGRVLSVPVIQQELPLSCEIAGMRMMSAGVLGNAPLEEQLLSCLVYDPNPYLGFRGDPAGFNRTADGSINWDNYGVYAPAVAETLNRCVLEPAQAPFRAVAATGVSYKQVERAILDGYPVLVWVAKQDQAVSHTVLTNQGPVSLVFGEHVWVVVGYHEDGTFEVHDPYPQKSGQQTFRVSSFLNWDRFDRMAVFVVPRSVSSVD